MSIPLITPLSPEDRIQVRNQLERLPVELRLTVLSHEFYNSPPEDRMFWLEAAGDYGFNHADLERATTTREGMVASLQDLVPSCKTEAQQRALLKVFAGVILVAEGVCKGDPNFELAGRDVYAAALTALRDASPQRETQPVITGEVLDALTAELTKVTTREDLLAWYVQVGADVDSLSVVERNHLFAAIRAKKASLTGGRQP